MPGVIVVMAMMMPMAVSMSVMMVATPAQQPNAGHVHGQAKDRDRDCLGKADRHGRKQAADGLVADQDGDHRQHDRAGEPGQVAQLAGAEGEAGVGRVAAGEGVGQRRQQQRARVRAHVQAVRHQRDRSEHQAAAGLQHHHRRAERDDPPAPPLVGVMAFPEDHGAVGQAGGVFGQG